MKHKVPALAWIPLIAAIFFVGGWCTGNYLMRNSHGNSAAEKKLNTILNLIKSEYVDTVNLDSLMEYTLPELLLNLDPHSAYIPASELRAVNEDLDGSFSGIGISFHLQNDTIIALEVFAGGPAEKVGMQAGDRIIKIDGENVAGVGINDVDVRSKLRGAPDTKVKVTVKRQNSKRHYDYEITRGEIPNFSVNSSYIVDNNIGVITVGKFTRGTYSEFLNALNTLSRQGATSFIIDLRGNGGGVMESAILMANEFLPDRCIIMSKKGRNGRNDEIFLSDGTGSFTNVPLTVLIDEYSASASEILAGAIQDNDRGLVIGRRSFGKGLIQQQMVLPDSSAVRLTIARYYTPSGRCIQKKYQLGQSTSYYNDILERYDRGEAFSADSIKLDKSEIFTTIGGRQVYGGGGIMPDIFVPNDTSAVTSYSINVINSGMLQKFAFEYCDLNRRQLSAATDVDELLKHLPSDDILLRSFVNFASQNGIPARWYYINISQPLIVNLLKALIARDILGTSAYYQIVNRRDRSIDKAIEMIREGKATAPITNTAK